MMTMVGIDLREDSVNAVAVDETGTVLARSTQPATVGTANAVRTAFQEAAASGTGAVAGFTLPFQVDVAPADVTNALTQVAGRAPVSVSAGQAVALAETWCGAARGRSNVISFAIADHVTAGILVGGNILRGANGHAGSVAWLALNPVEREDYRRFGGLEAEVAAAGIVKRLVWRIKSGDQSKVADIANRDLSGITADDVFAAARAGDFVSISVVRDTAKYVGMAVANLAAVVDPECVVLGGTLATAGDLMLEPIRAECSRRLRAAQSDRVRIVLSTLGDDAAAIGAARAALLENQ